MAAARPKIRKTADPQRYTSCWVCDTMCSPAQPRGTSATSAAMPPAIAMASANRDRHGLALALTLAMDADTSS